MCNLIEDGDSRRARLRLPRTHRWWLALRIRLRDPDDGSVARHLVASARGGTRIPRPIEQVSLQLPVAATRGGIVQARLTFPTRPAKSCWTKWNAWSWNWCPGAESNHQLQMRGIETSRWPASPSSSIYRPSVEPPLQLPSSVQKTRPPAEREGAGSGTRVLGPPPDDGAVGAYEQTASTELARLVGGKGGRSAALARRCDNLDIGMADRIQAGRMDDGVRAPVAYHGQPRHGTRHEPVRRSGTFAHRFELADPCRRRGRPRIPCREEAVSDTRCEKEIRG